jgi:hypothetical protein
MRSNTGRFNGKAWLLAVLTGLPLSLVAQEKLIYHPIQTDRDGHILPWYDPDPRVAFDHIIRIVWDFWDTMRTDPNGLPYYMNHQVWQEGYNDRRGIGGDQLQMALSSWRLLYAYTGDERVRANMRFMADYYLSHSLSPATAAWPDIPYPYNTLNYSGMYDGDMVIGKYYTQPDKAGSFALELVHLYKMTGLSVYLDAAVAIANTLAAKTENGDGVHSPMPFKVNALTGETGMLTKELHDLTPVGQSSYTSNWAPTMELFLDLQQLHKGNTPVYAAAFDRLLRWMKQYPLKTNKWGPFFEDVAGWSDTQINAMTFARFIMEHREYFPDWQGDVKGIVGWVYRELGNRSWEKYGMMVVNEQTWYRTPANSHTARQAADELLYVHLTGDSTWYRPALLRLNWATYMVDNDGKNRFPTDDIWLTDGYGDYIRHYLRAMAAEPRLAPKGADHILSSTSVVRQAYYASGVQDASVRYETFDGEGSEVLTLKQKPQSVTLNDNPLQESISGEGYTWRPLEAGGVLTIRRINGNTVKITY